MSDKLPWMPFYGSDFYHDEAVRLMSAEEECAYLRLLWYQWREGSLPAEPEHLAKLSGCICTAITPLVLSRLPVTRDADGRRRNPRLEEIRREQLAMIEAKSRAAKIRWAKEKGNKMQRMSGADASHKHSISNTDTESDKKKRPRGARRADDVVLPPGYLDAACTAWEKARGVPNRGLIGKVLKPLVRAHGPRQVALAWEGYLYDRNGKDFCHPMDFSTNYEVHRRKWAVLTGETGEDIPVPDEPFEAIPA